MLDYNLYNVFLDTYVFVILQQPSLRVITFPTCAVTVFFFIQLTICIIVKSANRQV